MQNKKKFFKIVAHSLLLSLGYQLVFPACAYALTTGPSQPEVQSFEPVGTTEMVDMFTGDFNYNIPLLDVEGYPVNIFYHSGVGIEQEASWVGLGWNINPGEINRTVRGLPDDFKGETIEKYTKIKEERDIRIGIGANVAAEIFGKDLADKLSLTVGSGFYINHNNYRGLSAGITRSVGIRTPVYSAGVSFGIGSQSGADIDFNAGASLNSKDQNGSSFGVQAGIGTGFNSRYGLKDISLSVAPSYNAKDGKKQNVKAMSSSSSLGTGMETSIPIGLQNYVPMITNPVTQSAYALQLKAGGELYGAFTSGYVDAQISTLKYGTDGSRPGFGFMYTEDANRESIKDFSRDKDGTYNETMKNLPLSANTYDVYAVNGQGTGGMFRPFRNDIGTVNDPYVDPGKGSEDFRGLIEVGIGNLFTAGGDLTTVRTRNESGPWVSMAYGRKDTGSLYEKLFFKQGGDISYNQQQEAGQLFNLNPQYLFSDLNRLVASNYTATSMPAKYRGTNIFWNNSVIDRSSRITHIAFRTAEEEEQYTEDGMLNNILSYENGTGGRFYDPKIKSYARYTGSKQTGLKQNAAAHHISSFTQTMADGRRYVYDLPAMNNVSREVSFAVDESKANLSNGNVWFNRGTDDGLGNNMGNDKFYSTTNTPSYAHAYLMTGVLSNDYVDVLGDGMSDDDLGSFTKFNYTLTDNDYRWRTPYDKDTAQYNPGFWSDSKDARGNYLIGSRQQWYVRSIETKNYIAEFYTSQRKDGRGIQASVLPGDSKINVPGMDLKNNKSQPSYSYQLDSIRLYNKHDRYINKDNAVPVKTVILQYDYSLCRNTPNSVDAGKGKLTLKKIFIKYGNSEKNLLSPYVFTYSSSNPSYDFAAKDRWGNYKAIVAGVRNYEFPYTAQPDDPVAESSQNTMLSSWNLTEIKLPSGGKIKVDYESDDYAFVQDKRAMEMMQIVGLGATPNLAPTNQIYIDEKNINDYVYFKRRKTKERPGLSMKDNYLEGQDVLCYKFYMDITGKNNYEYIKAYAKFDEVDICPNNTDYGYVKLRRDNVKGMNLHPATVYGINTARYYLPHLFYEGYQESSDIKNVVKGMFASGKEMLGSLLLRNPFKRWVNESRGKYIRIQGSSIRLHTASMAKKGGGIRVKRLVLSDSWTQMTGTETAEYGKDYDYTCQHPRYGLISSGVASYEPMIGAEENPFRRPIPYTADEGRMLPAIHFFQEEPFGESFFPGPSVGYSSVKVSSIHKDAGRSSQAVDEYLFYTAKDFPIKVEYTQIDGDKDKVNRSWNSFEKQAELMQGYAIVLNDMHGKPKAVNNYVGQVDVGGSVLRKITGTQYNYFADAGKLNNNVNVLVRKRGTADNYDIRQVLLGQDIDVSIDSRQRVTETFMNKTNLNLNVFMMGILPIFPFTVFHQQKDKTISFKSLVTTKIIQQYGMLRSIESFDHDAITTTENMLFDGETGNVLLTRTNNQYNDFTYIRKSPAYLAYEGMMPAYTNTDYEEIAEKLEINSAREGFLYTTHMDRFSPGDEIWADITPKSQSMKKQQPVYMKFWITNASGGRSCNADTLKYNVAFWKAQNQLCTCSGASYFGQTAGTANVTIYNAAAPSVVVASGSVSNFFNNASTTHYPSCADSAYYWKCQLPVGTYNYTISGPTIYGSMSTSSSPYSGTFSITSGKGVSLGMHNCLLATGPGTQTLVCQKVTDQCLFYESSDVQERCIYAIAPRYKNRFISGSATNTARWPLTATTYTNVPLKVARSGRRNNLDKMVQEVKFAAPAARTPFYTDAKSLFEKADNVIAATVTTYTHTAKNYADVQNKLDIPFVAKYEEFNPYVLGLMGNFRPLASYAPIAQRSYVKNHARYNGTYEMSPFWDFMKEKCPTACDGLHKALSHNDVNTKAWKKASAVTAYDPGGNAVEEQDAIGNYSAAQYGYNKQLPVAVASNSRLQHIMFEGFEDYNMLLPQFSYLMYQKHNLHSALAESLGDPIASLVASYPSEQPTGDPAVFSRNNQRYYLVEKAPSGLGMQLSSEASHTGNYSLKFTTNKNLVFKIDTTKPGTLQRFTLQSKKNYVLNFWAKSTSGAAITASMFDALVNPMSSAQARVLNSGSIDGWYLVQVNVNLEGISSGTPVELVLTVPSGVYIDDIRLLPSQANMKCFVYHPLTLRLMAQLDENHFATFYEYDQEGLLIRTKKETVRGIMTISESRRANTKKNY